MAASKDGFGNPEISDQPGGLWTRSLSKFRNDIADPLDVETIEEKMGDDQIVAVARHPRHNIVLKKRHATYLARNRPQNALPSQVEHSFAAIDAIDLDQRLALKKRSQKSPVPLTHDQNPARRTDSVETSDASPLQCVSESDCFQRPVPRRDRIKAHNAVRISNRIGVSRTRSASAVRSS